jgi:DNA-binding NtrC family response regulator
MGKKILIVDDDPDIVLGLQNRVAWMGHEALTAADGQEALRLIPQEDPDVVLLDVKLPGLSGLDVLEQLGRASGQDRRAGDYGLAPLGPAMPLVIMLTAFGTIELAVQAMQLGAVDFLTKPFTGEHLTVVINKALATLALRRQVDVLQREVSDHYGPIIGTNAKFTAQLDLARRAAASTVTILILGETGTGKEVVARAIHDWSPRKSKPFVAVNCAAIPKDLLENELFGHERGAFTGAVKREAGRIEVAEGGTVFLDEIGDMSVSLQSHLLRLLQDQTFYRVGGTKPMRADVRFLAATNKDLTQAIHDGTFREDLYYRLEGIAVRLPPLRERLDDVPALARHFVAQSVKLGVQKQMTISDAAMDILSGYRWPGNIRELENVLTRALILASGTTIEPQHLHLSEAGSSTTRENPLAGIRHYHDRMEAYSRHVLEEALQRNGWNQTRAAEDLGLQRTYFTKLLRQKQISGHPPKTDAPPAPR